MLPEQNGQNYRCEKIQADRRQSPNSNKQSTQKFPAVVAR